MSEGSPPFPEGGFETATEFLPMRFVFLLLITALCLAPATAEGPLELESHIAIDYGDYSFETGARSRRAYRVTVSITNPTTRSVDVGRVLGKFFDYQGEPIYLDEEILKVGAGETEVVILYFPNEALIEVSSAKVTATYRIDGQAFGEQILVKM